MDRRRTAEGRVAEGAEPVGRRWVIEGRVQGVGFRWYVLDQAQALGVRGWVRNTEDGAVEVVGLASSKSLSQLDAILAKGPPGARITGIIRDEVPHQSVESKSFKIKH
ncbi:MAG: acylphosphatase [Gemmatimonadota bacterium]